MDARQVTRELRRKFPHATILSNGGEDTTELICEVESVFEHSEFNRIVAVIDRIPGNFNRRSKLTWRVLEGTLNLFPHGQRQILTIGESYTIEPYVLYWAEGDATWVEIRATPAWTIDDRRVVGPEEDIRLEPPDPSWSQKFEGERSLVERTLGDSIQGGVHHVGSTAIPGIAAKPIVDMMVGVQNLERARACIPLLAWIGYEHLATLDASMLWFCKPSLEHRIYHLYLVEPTTQEWTARLAFRDYLRSHAEARQAYEDLKVRLARQHKDDRAAYTNEKGAFVSDIVRRALANPGSLQ